jgi:hypothetical protein
MPDTRITPLKLKPDELAALDRLAGQREMTRTGAVRTLIAEALAARVCHWCGRPATDGHKIVVRSEYVGGIFVNEYCCDPDCRSDTVGGAT